MRYIRSFIAGATSTGHAGGQRRGGDERVGLPWASLAIVLALAGRDQVRVGVLTSARWLIGARWGGRLAGIGAAQRVGVELADEHRRAGDPGERLARRRSGGCSVWITRTAWPARIASRAVSSAL